MKSYFFIQSQDLITDNRAKDQFDLAINLAKSGEKVRILLIQNGVINARKGVCNDYLNLLIQSGVKIFADTFSLNQREITPVNLHESIVITNINTITNALINEDKVIWW